MREENQKINRDNYPIFLADYLDRKLSNEQEEEFLEFLSVHPDLMDDFQMLQSTNANTKEVKSPGFDFLKKGAETDADYQSWDSWQVAHLEGDLSAVEYAFFLELLKSNENLKREAALYELTQSKPDTGEFFPNKAILYRRETFVGVLPHLKTILRVAAILIFLMIAGGYLFNHFSGISGFKVIKTTALNQNASKKKGVVSINSTSEEIPNQTKPEQLISERNKESKFHKNYPTKRKIQAMKIAGITYLASSFEIKLMPESRQLEEFVQEGIPVAPGHYFAQEKNKNIAANGRIYEMATNWLSQEDSTALRRINAPVFNDPGIGLALASRGIGFINRISGADLKIAQTFSEEGEVKKIGIGSSGFAFQWTPK